MKRGCGYPRSLGRARAYAAFRGHLELSTRETALLEVLAEGERVFLLVLEADAQDARLARATSAQRTEGVKQQIRDGRPIFQARMLAAAIPLDATASPESIADTVLAHA